LSVAAIEEAIRQTSGGCTVVCDKHRLQFGLAAATEEVDNDDEAEDENNDTDDGYDGT